MRAFVLNRSLPSNASEVNRRGWHLKSPTTGGGSGREVQAFRNTVRIIHATLRAMLNAAVDDGAILANPANRLGRQLRLVTAPAARQEEIKAMTREQMARFLAAATRTVPGMHALFLLMARTGMRLGEAMALKWPDVDVAARPSASLFISVGHRFGIDFLTSRPAERL